LNWVPPALQTIRRFQLSVNRAHKHHHLLGLSLAHWKLSTVSCFIGGLGGLCEASAFQAVKHTHCRLAYLAFGELLSFLLLGVLLCQLNTLRYRFLHFLDHLRFFELQLTKFFLLQLYHLLLRHHFLVQILLVAQLAQLCV
jgi:hypothetical protein